MVGQLRVGGTMRRVIALLCLTIGFWSLSAACSAQDQRRDGNYWRGMSKTSKLDYVTGFFDGMQLGHYFSYWAYTTGPQKNDAIAGGAVMAYGEYSEKYLRNVTNGQLVDGLDAFYSDFQNRRIRVYSAVWLVTNQISGNASVGDMILNFRRHSD